VILLDTNAFIGLEAGHQRAEPVLGARLALSPATVLELACLAESGRLTPNRPDYLEALTQHARVRLDQPPASEWFLRATGLTFTRDRFDRLIAAHALLRGWRLATGDRRILDALGPERTRAV
jgi:PIN domain nuclease of toxin-antitoxin system